MCVYCLKCTKFGKLFVRKVIKTVATRCLDFSTKHPKMRLAAGLCPDPLGELKRSPRPPSRKRGPTSKGRGKGGKGGRGWQRGEGRREGRDFAGPIKIWLLRPCLSVKSGIRQLPKDHCPHCCCKCVFRHYAKAAHKNEQIYNKTVK